MRIDAPAPMLRPLPDGRFRVLADWHVHVGDVLVTVREGYVSDGPTWPWLVRALLRVPLLGSLVAWLIGHDTPAMLQASILHDWLYSHQDDARRIDPDHPRRAADRIWRDMGRAPLRWPMYWIARWSLGGRWRDLALLLITATCLSGCLGVRVVEDERMRHIAQQSRDLYEVGEALEQGAPADRWAPHVQRMAKAIFSLTGEEWGDDNE